MDTKEKFVSFYTIVRKDVFRIVRLWPQTLLPSLVTSTLYFLIFGTFLGSRIGHVGDVPYMNFVMPGLVMLAVVTNAFSNVATTFFTAKFFTRNIEEILVSPTPPWVIIAGFVSGGVVRGLMVGVLVMLASLFFGTLVIHNVAVILAFLFITSLVFSLAGLVNGIYAKNFDGISIVPTFVLTPMTYLGGVFYSVAILPEPWQTISHFNPIFYIINGFRYGFLGTSDVSLAASFSVLIALAVLLFLANLYLMKKGLGLKQ
ncbi:MAG: ABC transporter permease [Candidatus Lloydbacteria bacterium RIFCSPHIGHO2_02_FULL_51_22]|uniref:Transport permease protein n=1 Tax=Candidatus Lloydbacteria bacterium RIFCSPHIGHO2_02_FULL_51_22 TaxID=1798663 RepID=A0A1G2DE09_9BACT|nr:MAG: ABC transporter permease [Candidatus Lloydbacteria bacterium RIFCSPHIGHO2_02_FULL_51_22]